MQRSEEEGREKEHVERRNGALKVVSHRGRASGTLTLFPTRVPAAGAVGPLVEGNT